MNLAGQEALARGDLSAARQFLNTAREALPSSPDIAVNLSELASRESDLDGALSCLAAFPDTASCRNQAGNVLARAAEAATDGEAEELLERAAREYLRAVNLEPSNADYQANLAAVYLELERYSDAEERIRKSLDLGSTPRALLLAGNLAMVYGDFPRAEAAYRLGLESSPGDGALTAGLARCYLALQKTDKATELARSLEHSDPERSAKLIAEIEEATTEALSCASCGRIWRVPRVLPPQSASSIRAMPPDDSPAGACPDCGRIFCIACRKADLADKRFTCPDCGSTLKLLDDRLRYLVRESLRRAKSL
jgi:tetratricopeptide (TPR) repeat protein